MSTEHGRAAIGNQRQENNESNSNRGCTKAGTMHLPVVERGEVTVVLARVEVSAPVVGLQGVVNEDK